MANKGYTTEAAVASFLGTTFTGAQTAEAAALIGAAESLIDRETRKAWLVPAITAERYDLRSPTIYLRSHPVTSVSLVQTRTQAINDTLYTAIANVDYEVFDLTIGQINFSEGYTGPKAIALVSYVPNLPVPADITHAATQIVAETIAHAIFPDRLGVQQATVDKDVILKYTDYGVVLRVPQIAQQIIDGYRLPIF